MRLTPAVIRLGRWWGEVAKVNQAYTAKARDYIELLGSIHATETGDHDLIASSAARTEDLILDVGAFSPGTRLSTWPLRTLTHHYESSRGRSSRVDGCCSATSKVRLSRGSTTLWSRHGHGPLRTTATASRRQALVTKTHVRTAAGSRPHRALLAELNT